MSFVAILQKLSGTEKLLWVVDVANMNLGAFAYRNQSAAFLHIGILSLECYISFYERKSSRKLETSGPHLCLFYYLYLFLSGSIWLSLSRSGVILGSLLFGLFLILAFFNVFLRGII